MDQRAYALAGGGGTTAIEFTRAGIAFSVEAGETTAGFAGGAFTLRLNEAPQSWPARLALKPGDIVDITPGPAGNYGYVRFDHDIDVPAVMGSRATNLIARIGGFEGRALRAGDRLRLGLATPTPADKAAPAAEGPIRVLWGLHAEPFMLPRAAASPRRVS